VKKKYFQRAALILVAVLGLKGGFQNFSAVFDERVNDAAVIADWEKRLSKLVEPIPFERGLVGYLSASESTAAGDAEGEFVLAQYALAPLILERGTEQEWNILNLDPETFKQWLREHESEFELVRAGGGMYLVRKAAP